MKYYTSTTEFNCGIHRHARQMYVSLMDRQGKIRVHTSIKNNDFPYFLKLIAPYRHDLTVACKVIFGWHWLADACQAAGLTFVLARNRTPIKLTTAIGEISRKYAVQPSDECRFGRGWRLRTVRSPS